VLKPSCSGQFSLQLAFYQPSAPPSIQQDRNAQLDALKGPSTMLTTVIQRLIGTSTFIQILFALPLSLDWLGPPSFLLLSLLLITYHFASATIKLLSKNTPAASLTGLLDLAQPLVPAACGLVTCYLYLHPSDGGESSSLLGMDSKRLLGVYLPAVYAKVLRLVSPVFSVLEGFATLLVSPRSISKSSEWF
jgi:hypothetical protein